MSWICQICGNAVAYGAQCHCVPGRQNFGGTLVMVPIPESATFKGCVIQYAPDPRDARIADLIQETAIERGNVAQLGFKLSDAQARIADLERQLRERDEATKPLLSIVADIARGYEVGRVACQNAYRRYVRSLFPEVNTAGDAARRESK